MKTTFNFVLVAGLGVAGCGGSTTSCTATASSYESPAYEANTVAERALREQLKAFTQPMKDAEADLARKPTAAELRALFDVGTPSLRSVTSPFYASRVDQLLEAFALAAGNAWTPSTTPTGNGGKFGSYIFTASGTDLRQAIEKGMFAGTFFHHANSLANITIDATMIDRFIAAFGAHPSFPGDDKAATNPDELAATYAERRDKKDPSAPGVYLLFKQAAIDAKAAIAGGTGCRADRDAAVRSLFTQWERAVMATVIFYLNDVTAKLSAASPTEADRASALHGYGEVVAFIAGWHSLDTTYRKITDAQVVELLTTLGVPPGGTITSYKLLTDTATELPRLTQVITTVAGIYGFSAQEIEQFKTNY